MRVDALHKRVVSDVQQVYGAVSDVLPATMPSRYGTQKLNVRPLIKRLNTRTKPLNIVNDIIKDPTMTVGNLAMGGFWLAGFFRNLRMSPLLPLHAPLTQAVLEPAHD